jgi:hypothetical protein
MSAHRRRLHPVNRFVHISRMHFRMPPQLGLVWWWAMRKSNNVQVEHVRKLFDDFAGRAEAFIVTTWRQLPPQTLIASVEHLCAEGLLERCIVIEIEKRILAVVGPNGRWL